MKKLRQFAKESGGGGAIARLGEGLLGEQEEALVARFLGGPGVPDGQVEEAVAGLSTLWQAVASCGAARRRRLLRDYRASCGQQGVPPADLPAMQTVILLSQLLGRQGAAAADLAWVLGEVGKLAAARQEPLVREFFLSIGSELDEVVEDKEAGSGEEVEVTEVTEIKKVEISFNKKKESFDKMVKNVEVVKKVNNEEKETVDIKESGGGVVPEEPAVDEAEVVVEFKALRLRLGLSQKAAVAEVRGAAPHLAGLRTVDLAKFELRHSAAAVARFLPGARAWLAGRQPRKTEQTAKGVQGSEGGFIEKKLKEEVSVASHASEKSRDNSDITQPGDLTDKVKSEPVENSLKPVVRVKKLTATETTTSPAETVAVEEAVVVKQEPVLVAMERREWLRAGSPEVVDLEEEEREYRFLCRDCEGELGCGGDSCPHTAHPRLPLEFDLSAHIARTNHVDIRPLAGLLGLRPLGDVAYSLQHGAEVRRQWKDMVLAGPSVVLALMVNKLTGLMVEFSVLMSGLCLYLESMFQVCTSLTSSGG